MARAGRPQGVMKGTTRAANDLARFLAELTDELTVREMARRYGGSKTVWGEYRCGARIIPLGRLNAVVRDRVRDPRGRTGLLQRARRLHEAALTAEAAADPGLDPDEALRRAEAGLAESERLVRGLLVLVATLLPEQAATPDAAARTGHEPDPGQWSGTPPQTPGDGPGPATRGDLLDRAFDQLGAVWDVHRTSERILSDLGPPYRQALDSGGGPTAPGPTAPVRQDISLALARTAGELEHSSWELEQLRQEWLSDVAGDDPHGTARATPLEGVVLERTDRPSWAHVTRSWEKAPSFRAPAQLPAAPGDTAEADRGGPPHSRLAAVAAAAVLGIAALTVIAGALVAQRTSAGPAADPAAELARERPPATAGLISPRSGAPASTPATPPSAGAAPSGASTPSSTAPAPLPSARAGEPPSAFPSPSGSSSATASPGSAPPSAPPNGLIRFANAGSRLCLAVPPGSTTPSDGLVQSRCGSSPEQQWHITPEGTGPSGQLYSVRNRHSGLCLSVDAARTTNDALITHYLCGDRQGLFPDQFWTLRHDSASQAWHLVNVNSGKCVSSRAGGAENEGILQQDCREDPWLMWRM